MIGQTLNNRYTINKRLGKGAMGTVYRATDSQSGQDVAVKLIARELAFDPDMLERFRREGEALRQLKHPNIVGFIDAFQYEEQYAIVLEFVPGGSLHELVKQGPLPIDRAQRMALELCDALTRAHHLNIIHRDLKPENVLIDTDGTPKLTDFGVARLVSEGNRLTGTGTQIGTPYYMSPEAWEGKALDAQADIWSLGVVLYEMLSGEVPFGGETLVAVMNKVLNASLPDLKVKRADIPDGLAQIINRMLTRDKAARYRSMREVAADLERGGPVVATPVAAPTVPVISSPTKKVKEKPAPSAPRQFPGRVFALGGAAIAVSALAVAGILLIPRFIGGVNLSLTSTSTTVPNTVATKAADLAATQAAPTVAPSFVTDGTLGKVLFEDDFEGGLSPEWEVDSEWRMETIDGRSVLYGAGPKDGNFAHLSQTWSDHTAQFDFQFIKPDIRGAPHILIYARMAECPAGTDWISTYTASLLPGNVTLMKGVCDKPREWITLAETPHEVDPLRWYNLQFSLIGNRVLVYLDGEKLINYVDTDAPILNGHFSLSTSDGTEALFDNVRVTEIIPGLACAPGETELFSDNFQDGDTTGWFFHDANGVPTGAWSVDSDGANSFLVGEGHNWTLAGDENWADYRLAVRVRLAAGNSSAHLNILKFSGESRYYLNYPGGGLSKDPSAADLTQTTFPRDDQWHLVTLSSAGGLVVVTLDGETVVSYEDPDPLRPGNIGLENLSGTVWYDDVLVCTASAEETVEPVATTSSSDAVAAALADPWGAVVIPSGESILLGVASDLSGGAKDLGLDQRDAVLLALDYYGPLAGFTVAVDSQDDACTPEGGRAAATALIGRDSLAAVVGTTCSAALNEAMPIFDSAHVVFISPSATRAELSQNGLPTFNRVALSIAVNPSDKPLADPNSAAYKEVAAKFKKKFGRDCCAPYAAEAFDATMILLKSIESVAVVDEKGQLIIPRQALAQAVRGTANYEGVSGTITFDENGDRVP